MIAKSLMIAGSLPRPFWVLWQENPFCFNLYKSSNLETTICFSVAAFSPLLSTKPTSCAQCLRIKEASYKSGPQGVKFSSGVLEPAGKAGRNTQQEGPLHSADHPSKLAYPDCPSRPQDCYTATRKTDRNRESFSLSGFAKLWINPNFLVRSSSVFLCSSGKWRLWIYESKCSV